MYWTEPTSKQPTSSPKTSFRSTEQIAVKEKHKCFQDFSGSDARLTCKTSVRNEKARTRAKNSTILLIADAVSRCCLQVGTLSCAEQ